MIDATFRNTLQQALPDTLLLGREVVVKVLSPELAPIALLLPTAPS